MIDVLALRAFYGTPLGIATRAALNTTISRHFDGLRGMNVIGIGYPTPYLGLFRHTAARSLALMPMRQGVIHWPTNKPSKAALVDETHLPVMDAVADRLIIVHALENMHQPEAFLHEAWRILAAGGRAIVIVPNRVSIWARHEKTPFGQGHPYSRMQLLNLLKQTGFTPISIKEALWFAPSNNSWSLKIGKSYEALGAKLNLPLGGVHVIEVKKEVFRPLLVERKALIVPSLRAAFNNNRENQY
jgi:SAM-dependent methyltransferase